MLLILIMLIILQRQCKTVSMGEQIHKPVCPKLKQRMISQHRLSCICAEVKAFVQDTVWGHHLQNFHFLTGQSDLKNPTCYEKKKVSIWHNTTLNRCWAMKKEHGLKTPETESGDLSQLTHNWLISTSAF